VNICISVIHNNNNELTCLKYVKITTTRTTSQLQETSAHKSTTTHASNAFLCLVTLTLDVLTPKINGFPGLMVEHSMPRLVTVAALAF